MSKPSARLPAIAAEFDGGPYPTVPAFVAAAFVLLLAALSWAPHLSNSLWLDETLTYWVVQDGFFETLERGVQFQSQPAYYALIWLWTQVAGTSETALRLPSLLASIAACIVAARLGKEIARDPRVGLFAMVVFASSATVFREAVDARSYMLGLLALLCLALSLIRWLRDGRSRNAWLVGGLGALLPHLHLFFVLAYPAFILYGLLSWRGSSARFRQLGLIAALLALGALLSIPVAMTLLTNGGAYSFAPPPQWSGLFSIFVWPTAVAGLIAGVCLATMLTSPPDRASEIEEATAKGLAAPDDLPIRREVGALLAVWVLLPLFLLFSVSMWTDHSLFLSRYLVACVPAVSLVYGIALRAIPRKFARAATNDLVDVVIIAVIGFAAIATYTRPHDDFRGATHVVNEFVAGDATIPVLLATGLIETQDEKWLRNPAVADYLNSPTAYYPIGGTIVTMPRRAQRQDILNERVGPVLRSADRFAVIEWTGNGARVIPWLIPRAEQAGFHKTIKRGFGGVRVVLFTLASRTPRP